VATQDERLQYGLVVPDKADRVFNYHYKTVDACLDLVAASGHVHPHDLSSSMVMVRQAGHAQQSYGEINPPLQSGELLRGGGNAPHLRRIWDEGVRLSRL